MSPMFPLPVEEFGGLDLVNAPDEVAFSGAVDLLNVEFGLYLLETVMPGRTAA